MLFGNKYTEFRDVLFTDARSKKKKRKNLSFSEKVNFLFENCSRQTARLIQKSYDLRAKLIFH